MIAVLLAATIAIPPPLCRGKSYGRFDPSKNRTPTARAIAEIRMAYDALCPMMTKSGECGTGEIYQNETIGNNAVTWVSGIGQGAGTRVTIVYSPDFLNGLDRQFGPGASFGVLAHEVGHHLTAAGNLRSAYDHSWDEELRADWFAGCALAIAGSETVALESTLRALASVATPTHPSFAARTPKVREGYKECAGLRKKRDKAAATIAPFGLGAEIAKKEGRQKGCFAFFRRKASDVENMGPIAAPRERVGPFADREACERSRRAAVEGKQLAPEECGCL